MQTIKKNKFTLPKEKLFCCLFLLLLLGSFIGVMIIKANNINTTMKRSIDIIDLTSTISENDSYYLDFMDDEISNSDSVFLQDRRVMITKGGTYILKGIAENYQIYINAPKQIVILVCDNVSITSLEGPAIFIEDAKKTIINVKVGTTNYFSTINTQVEYDNGEEMILTSGCIESRDNLTINGMGTLYITAQTENGIDCKDSLYLVDAEIVINACNHGIEVNDGLEIINTNLQIISGGDGLKAANEAEELGYVSIFSGNITISSFGDGISTTATLGIETGTITIDAGVNNTNTNQKSGKGLKTATILVINGGTLIINSKDDSLHSDQNIVLLGGDYTLTSSKNGIKAENEILIQKGILKINSSADALNSENKIIITGGELTITARDDGIKADNNIQITDGMITILNSYEGMESINITLKGGKTSIIARDDGININCSEQMGGFGPQTSSTTTSSSGLLKISGGYLFVNAGGDGLDSNDQILITGGTTIVWGPTNSGNGALDYGSECKVTGGVLIVAGSSGMAENISSSSTQCGTMINFSSSYNSNQLICITDKNNNLIFAFRPEKNFQSIVVSSSELHLFSNYKVYVGGTITGEEENGYYTNAIYANDGTLYTSFKQSERALSIGERSMMGGRK